MEQDLRLRDEKLQCKAASACWKVAYSDPDCRDSLGLVITHHTSRITHHASHITHHTSKLTLDTFFKVVIAALVDSLGSEYVPLQERASGALATLSSR